MAHTTGEASTAALPTAAALPGPMPWDPDAPIPPGPEPEWRDGWPILHEDDGYAEMGDAAPHTEAIFILLHGFRAHLRSRHPSPAVLANLDLYYHPTDPTSYV